MSKINCTKHGLQKATRVCTHIVDTLIDRQPRGMYWTSDDDDEPCAWCGTCNEAYVQAGKEWTEELMKQVDEKDLCFSCFKLAQTVNGFGVN